MDLNEVLQNLGIVAKNAKITLDDHIYLQKGLSEISEKLKELEKLKEEKKEAK